MVEEALPVYQTTTGSVGLINNQLVTKFPESVSQTTRDSLIDFYHLELVSVSAFGMTVLRTTSESPFNSIETANLLYESGLTQYAHPDLAVANFFDFTPNDPLYQYQYYLNNPWSSFIDIDAPNAWEMTKDDSQVVVAVIDAGMQDIHEDLGSSKFFMGHDFVGFEPEKPHPDDDPIPDPTSLEAHGMCVAGIISGDMDNELGIAGITSGCRLMRLKIYGDFGQSPYFYPSVPAAAIEYACLNGADVINGSWSWEYPFTFTSVTEAVEQAADSGVVMVFSAGNLGAPVGFPASLDKTIAVGAIQYNGDPWSWSNYGNNLDLVSPAGGEYESPSDIYTLDIVGNGGYNPYYETCVYTNSDYVCFFGGTSAAAPQVAGIAALILSRPKLLASTYGDSAFIGYQKPWILAQMIKRILQSTALDEIGDSSDTPGHDPHYGYGQVNALRALVAMSRGDANNDGDVDISDIVRIINFLHYTEPPYYDIVPSRNLGNCNCDGLVDISDIARLIDYFYTSHVPLDHCFNFDSIPTP